MYNHSFASEYAVARPLALAAGDAILEQRRRHLLADPERALTDARRSASEIILEGIARAFPNDAILTRELADSTARLHADRVWIVEPLDPGDRFHEDQGGFATMIGLTVAATPVIGLIALPGEGVLYGAGWGAGAWIEEEGSMRPLRATPPADEQLRLLAARTEGDSVLERMCRNLSAAAAHTSGSIGLACGLVASARADLYLDPLPTLREWHCCAPDLIVREAGGSVTDFYGEPLRYNKRLPTQPHGIIACAPGLLEFALPRVTALFASAYAPRASALYGMASSAPAR